MEIFPKDYKLVVDYMVIIMLNLIFPDSPLAQPKR